MAMTRKKERIVLVANDAATAGKFMTRLHDAGYEETDLITNGEEAASQTATLHPDLIMMDVALTGTMSAMRIAAAIWQSQHVPIIFLTDQTDIELSDGVTTSRQFAYLSKACAPTKLVGTIELLIGKEKADQPSPGHAATEPATPQPEEHRANERRRHPRHQLGEGAFAFTTTTTGRIHDISMGGLSFHYLDRQAPLPAENCVDNAERCKIGLMDRDNGFFMQAISCRLVAQRPLASLSPFSMLRMIQCSMEFRALTTSQQNALESYITRHAAP